MFVSIALRLAEQNKLQKWTMKIEYEKAEMMIHVKDSETIRSEGLNTFSQLLETFPNDAILHYKVGRLYLYVRNKILFVIVRFKNCLGSLSYF